MTQIRDRVASSCACHLAYMRVASNQLTTQIREEVESLRSHRGLPCLNVQATQRLRELLKEFPHDERTDAQSTQAISELPYCKLLQLTQEQQDICEFPHSVFLQGRSGTGKTIVLGRRMLLRRAQASARGASVFSQLFVTKSSLLRDEVASQLRAAGCEILPPCWPSNGILCVTWKELTRLVMDAPALASVNFRRFLDTYWPSLQSRARNLSPELVWVEFNTRLRAFGTICASGVELSEYLQTNMAAVGVWLDEIEKKAIHKLFADYRRMKKRDGEFDDADVASLVAQALERAQVTAHVQTGLAHTSVDELYIDEAQDFSPAELTVLLTLCSNPDGVTITGDTCQTINPGSAFNFHDLMEAFCTQGRHIEERMRVHVQAATARAEKMRDRRALRQQQLAEAAEEKAVQARTTRGAFESRARLCKLFVLSRNYRSSPSVAQLAGSVTQLLLQRFPFCADRLDEHIISEQNYKLPVVAHVPDLDAGSCIMGTGCVRTNQMDPTRIAILVREDPMRCQLRAAGVQGTVLTVPEAKGLEFDFVILCGLLGDCPDGSVVWALANDESLETTTVARAALCRQQQSLSRALSEKERRLLCRAVKGVLELKSLYVGISRARLGCILLECNCETWAPLIKRWESADNAICWRGLEEYTRQVDKLHLSVMRATIDNCEKPQLEQKHGLHPLISVLEMMFANRENRAVESLKSTVEKIRARGLQLLSHACDDTRERWPVFLESHKLLVQGLAAVDFLLDSQIHEGSADPHLQPDLMGLAIRQPATLEVLWRQQMGAVLQGVCCTPSWRGSSYLRLLPRMLPWEQVFSFLAPAGTDSAYTHCQLALVVECIHEHIALKRELVHAAVCSHAWYKLSVAKYDSSAEYQESELAKQARSALRKENALLVKQLKRYPRGRTGVSHADIANIELRDCEGEQNQHGRQPKGGSSSIAAKCLIQLDDLLKIRVASFAEAGRAFLALNETRIAAETFSDAYAAAYLIVDELGSHLPLGTELCEGPLFETVEAANSRARLQALQAARCWLLTALDAQDSQRQEFLDFAELWFSRAGSEWSLQACVCAMLSGSDCKVLDRLARY